MKQRPSLARPLIAVFTTFLPGCGDGVGDEGSVLVTVAAEETIVSGLEPGEGSEAVVDGWSVQYERFVMTIGDFAASRSVGSSETLESAEVVVVDLQKLPPSGFVLAELFDVPADRFDRVHYDSPIATASARRDRTVGEGDYEALIDSGSSLWVKGVATKEATEIRFSWFIAAPTRYDSCGPEEGDLGFAVPSGGTAVAELTIHGDHWFFNGFPAGIENVERRAEWLTVADRDGDGEVTTQELAQSPAADLFQSEMYSLSGSPIPVETGLDWVTAQAHTLGHFQGEGECAAEPLNR